MARAGRCFLFVLGTLVLAIGTLEVGTRLLVDPNGEDARHGDSSAGFDPLQQFAADVSTCVESGVKYFEYFLYSPAPCATVTVNVSEFFSSRETPASAPAERAELTVWAFGGSTMQEFQTPDGASIANGIAKIIAAAGIAVRVENFGSTTFQTSLELIKYMSLAARVPADRLPDVVVFYDGYNDVNHGFFFGAGNMQNDLSAKLAALIERRSGTLFLYGASIGLANHSAFWQAHGHRRLERALFRDPDPQPNEVNLRRAVEIYVRNTRIADGICAAIRARCFFVLQPLIATKTPLGPLEEEAITELRPELIVFARQFYALAAAELQGDPGFVNASEVLNGRGEDVFSDLGHVFASGVPAVGELIAGRILARLREDAAPQGVAGRGEGIRSAVRSRPASLP